MTTPIQPHGVLLCLDGDLRVVLASANVEDLLGGSVQDLAGRHLAAIVGADLGARIRERVDEGFVGDPMVAVLGRPVAGDLAGREVDVRVHRSGERIVLELEPLPAVGMERTGDAAARQAIARLGAAPTSTDLARLLALEVRALTGFDRVMVFRFDGHGHAEVVAEDKQDGLAAFLGRHYAATDIPWQVRRLHQLNRVQQVVDLSADPVPLLSADGTEAEEPVDLSHAVLRSVPQVQVDYLSYSGVTAYLSYSVLVDDRLWGTVTGYHYAGPHRPAPEARSAAEFVTQVACHLIAHRERAEAREAAVDTQVLLAGLTTRLTASEGDVLDALFDDPALLEVFAATGAAQLFEGRLRTQGVVPERAVLDRINELLDVPGTYLSQSDHLAALDPALAEVADVAAGVLRVGTMSDRWGMWFRPEHSEAAARPEDVVPDAPSPRRSIAKWHEQMRGHSLPWEPWKLEAAEELGRKLNSLLLLRSREQVAMAESVQRSVMLDQAPVVAGVELVARYRPATTYQLGGDWWDAFDLDGGRRLAFVVGDVAGHGVAAASAMIQVRTALQAYLFEGHSPATCLDRLDLLIDGLLDVGVATALVGVFDRATGTVEIASAGHPDPVLVSPDGTATEVALPRRPLLGVGVGRAPVCHLDLPVGALLLLYTDGLIERRGTDPEAQTARLLHLATKQRDEDVEAWADRLLTVLDTTDDDTTLLALRRLR